MIQMELPLLAKDHFSESDYAWLENLSRFWEKGEEGADYAPFTDDETLADACAQLASDLLNNDPCSFISSLASDYAFVYASCTDETFAKLVVRGCEYGVACRDGACANLLGAMYYSGTFVDQDYKRAKELYELAESQGAVQAMINLGYIYEYGRTGERDYLKAFMQYAKASAAYDAPEALYKLGDMYSRGSAVEKDMRAAYLLYEKCLTQSETIEMQAQAAIRIARLVSSSEYEDVGIEFNPALAFELYQLAERGLRADIAQGQTYYRKRLQEAIDGQERMRELLDHPRYLP